MTQNMTIMFIVGFVIFAVYIYALLRAVSWGHKSQREEMLNDPEMRNYYARHGQDFVDYDGMGNYGRFPKTEMPKPKRRKKKSNTIKTKTKTTV
mgnify:CR=1 FL=1